MRTKQEIQQFLEKVLKQVTADEAQVYYGSGEGLATRFGENAITQNLSTANESLSLYVANGLQHGSSGTNQLDDEAIRSLVKRAEDIAANSPEDPEAMPVLGPQTYPELPGHFDENAAGMTPGDLADDVKAAVALAKKDGYIASGIARAGSSRSAVATSKGLFAFDQGSSRSFSITMHGPAGCGAAGDRSFQKDKLDPATVAAEALETAIAAQNPKDIEPGDHTVIFEPEAVDQLLGVTFGSLFARPADEGTTALAGKLGEKVLSDQMTLRTVIDDPKGPACPYVNDGLPAKAQTWIENGVIKRFYHDRYWAEQKGEEPDTAIGPMHLAGGEGTTSDLIARCDRGLLVKDLWYIRYVDARELLLTGMTRNGLFLVEDGKIVGPVKNLRFNESPLVFFRNIIARSAPKQLGGNSVPAIMSQDFTFSSTTESV